MLRSVKLTIEYDGTNYHGWQRQNNGNTIQAEVEKALFKMLNQKTIIYASGRTDRGVHATGQVANFYTYSKIPCEGFKRGLNSMLPPDISIKHCKDEHHEFHSRFSAKKKKYRYRIYNCKERSPINRFYTYHVKYKLDVEEMKKAAKAFVGEYDFVGFMSSGSDKNKPTIKRIYSLSVEKNKDNIDIVVEGSGFLHNMVRIIAGTLVDVGRGQIKASEMKDIIESKDRAKAGHTAPPQGLYLEEVYY